MTTIRQGAKGDHGAPRRRVASRLPALEAEPEVEAAVVSVDPFDRLRRGTVVFPVDGQSDAEDEHAWLTTYTDMVTLLLTCFIMLISLARFNETAPVQVFPVGSVDGAIAAVPTLTEPDADPVTRVPDALFLRQPPDTWSARLSRDLQRFVHGLASADGATVEYGEALVIVRLNDRLLFPSGKVELDDSGREILLEIAPIIQAAPATVEVQGHTDSVPISSWLFPSNWELSSARASAVVRTLIDGGVPADRLHVVGYADTAPRADNGTAEGRQENRRVEIVLRTRFDPPESAGIPAPAAHR